MAYSALTTVGSIVLFIVAQVIFGGLMRMGPSGGPPPETVMWLRPFLTFIAALVLMLGAAGFIAGWGLLQREEWGARWLSCLDSWRCSRFPSEPRSEFTRYGCCCPRNRMRSIERWRRRRKARSQVTALRVKQGNLADGLASPT